MLLLVSPSLTSSMIDAKDYCALDFLRMLGRSYSKFGLNYSIDRRVSSIYVKYRSKKDEAKIYAVSKSIVPRISKMDISSLTADAILSLTRSNEGEVGSILDPMGEKCKVSCNFAILPDLIIIEAFTGKFSREVARNEYEKRTGEGLVSHIAGSVVISPAGIEYTPNSVLQCVQSVQAGREDAKLIREYKEGFMEVIRVLKKFSTDEYLNKSVDELCERHPRETTTLKAYNEQHKQKYAALNYALKMFLYIHTSQTIKVDYISDGVECSNAKGSDCLPRGYIQVDTLWDTEIDVINPFAVKGHFTHQPYGPNSSLRKLIYIEDYMKRGYHRRATKDIVSSEK